MIRAQLAYLSEVPKIINTHISAIVKHKRQTFSTYLYCRDGRALIRHKIVFQFLHRFTFVNIVEKHEPIFATCAHSGFFKKNYRSDSPLMPI
jgi:hypothetical protein